MLITDKPKNIDNYVEVSEEISVFLHFNGFTPRYRYNGLYYFKRTNELIDFMIDKNMIERRM